MSPTEIADYKFTVKEGEPSTSGADDAPTWLMCEPISRELSIVGNAAFLSIRLVDGTTVAQAQAIAAYLQQHVEGIGYTRF